jgi:hypothetical protein
LEELPDGIALMETENESVLLFRIFIMTVLIIAGCWIYWTGYGDGYSNGQKDTTTCQEDDPCWDCHTMGNHICGDPTTPVVVTLP